ncbi:MAG: flagellar hook-length control protein FliK [Aquabacterium sp.]|nr:flagellar hook-length control protein FliK [Aquabacterium sp.]
MATARATTTAAALAGGTGRPAMRLAAEPAGRARDIDNNSRTTTRNPAGATDPAGATAATAASGDSLRSPGASSSTAAPAINTADPATNTAAPAISSAAAAASSAAAAASIVAPATSSAAAASSTTAAFTTSLPTGTPQPATRAASAPIGAPSAAASALATAVAGTERTDGRPAGGAGATQQAASPANASPAASTADATRLATMAPGMPATAADPPGARDMAGAGVAGHPAAPPLSAGVQAQPAPAVSAAAAAASAAVADRTLQADKASTSTPARAEAVADLASSFNALPLAATSSSPGVALSGSSTTAPVDASVPVPLDDPGFGAALGTQVSVLVRDGVQTARLQLNPAELGPIAVQIALDGSAARVDFQADLAGTRAAIEASLPALAGALQDAGFTLAGGGVFQQAPGRQGQGDAPANPGPTRQADGGNAAGSPLPALAAPQRSQRGLVDLVA